MGPLSVAEGLKTCSGMAPYAVDRTSEGPLGRSSSVDDLNARSSGARSRGSDVSLTDIGPRASLRLSRFGECAHRLSAPGNRVLELVPRTPRGLAVSLLPLSGDR